MKSSRSDCPVIELAQKPKLNYHVHYQGEYYGVVEARTENEALRKAKSKLGTHIVKDFSKLEVVRAS